VIEPAFTKTAFDANVIEPDAPLDEYRVNRAALDQFLQGAIAKGDDPAIVADVVLTAARAAHPKLRYAVGSLAGRLSLLRRFAPAALVDAGIRKDFQLDATTAQPRVTSP
jgi:hypothetical protein